MELGNYYQQVHITEHLLCQEFEYIPGQKSPLLAGPFNTLFMLNDFFLISCEKY